MKRRSFFRGLIAAVALSPAIVRAAEFAALKPPMPLLSKDAMEEFVWWYVSHHTDLRGPELMERVRGYIDRAPWTVTELSNR